MAQRVLDVVVAALTLVVLWPLFGILAVAVKLDSPGPVFHVSPRVGRAGRFFRLYKFRSMSVQAQPGASVTARQDSRITRVGRIMRPLRLDELPQLLNVLKGEMSLVGPRPETPAIVERYGAEHHPILDVRPGLTGPTQLAWLDEESRIPAGVDPTQYYVTYILPQKLQSDLRYVRTRSLRGDLRCLVQTPFALGRLVLARLRLGRLPKAARLAVDSAAVALATCLAYLLRFDGHVPTTDLPILGASVLVALAAYAVPFIWLRTYRSIWRYAGVEDFWTILRACLLGGLATGTAMYLVRSPFPRSVYILTPVLALLIMGGVRLGFRTAATSLGRIPPAERRRVVVVGAGALGESVAREILSTPDQGYEIVGFVDDDPLLQGARLRSVPVLGTTDQLSNLARVRGIDEAIIAIPYPSLAELRRIAAECVRGGVQFKTLPSVGQLIRGEGSLRYLRKVNLDELLGRAPAFLDPEKIAGFLRERRVLVTGAGGSIGSELCRQVVSLGADSLMMVERGESGLFDICAELQARPTRTRLAAALADIKHLPRMSELFENFKPDIVFHAAAYKHVPLLEEHPGEAVLNNVVGTARLARLAASHGTGAFVLVSTDKAVKPTSLMGATKRVCELYVMALNARQRALGSVEARTQFRVVRFGNVLGSAGSALPLFQQQIERGGAITITHPEMSRFFMTVQEAVALVLESVMLDQPADVLVLDMGEPVKITQLAEDLVTALGLPPSAVPKHVTGPRPGERLHEILWEDADEVGPSGHPRMVAVRHRMRPVVGIEETVEEIEQLALAGEVERSLQKITDIVPTYRPRSGIGRPSMVHLNGYVAMAPDAHRRDVPSHEPDAAA
jgi:FlaA1/EpsC-like NDP-sugar epimerase/lipopolysaccharide/colanic/teichoic acid biosynthesis glycosyltransferase